MAPADIGPPSHRSYGQSAGYIYLGTDTSRTGKASRAIVHGQGNTLHSLRKEDLLFRIPGLVSASTAEQSTKMLRLSPPEYLEDLEEIDARNLAAAAGRADRKRPVAPSESSPDAASEVTVDAEELWEEYGLDFGSKGWQDAFEAKLAVGRTLRNIVQQQEKIQKEILMKGIRDIYDRLVRAVRNAPKKGKSNSKGKSKATDSTFSSEGSTASSDIYVSTSQIYRELYCGEADFFTKEQEQFRMLAVHDYFLRDSEHYVADAIDILSSSRYRVRPPAEVDNLRTVREWVRKGSPEVVTFSAKVRDIRRRVKNATNSSVFPGAGHGELALLALPNIPTWTDADLAIIQFLQNSLEMKRKLQVNPYEAYAAILVKSLSPVKDGIAASSETEGIPAFMYMRVAVVRLLKDIGVYAEWENLVTRDREAGYEVWSKELEHARTHSPFAQRYIEPRDELDGIRHDFGDLPVYTIDDPGASELDDGISIESCPPSLNDGLGRQTFWIHAHIADPTSSLRPTDDLAQQARRRVTSSYLPEALWPMINFDIIEKQGWSLGRQAASPQTDLLAASIRPHQQEGQKVLTFSARLDEDGNVLEQTIRPGVVNNVIMTTYSAIDDLFRKETAPTAALSNSGAANDMPGDAIERLLWPTSHSHHDAADASKVPSRTLSPLPPSAVEDMARLDRLSTKVRMARVRSTALSWYGNSASVRLTTRPLQSSFEVLPTPTFYANQPSLEFSLPFPFSPSAAVSLSGRQQKEERSHAALLVSECMILAGRIAARHLGERGVPAPFRAQDPPAGASAAGIPDLLALRDPQTGEVDVSEVLRRRIELRPAYFSLTPAGHWPMGIGAEGYVRATSPLRRYTDLLAHWQIKGTLKHGSAGPPFSTADLQSLIGQTERVTRQRMRSENRAKTFWKTYLIRNKLEEVRKNPEADPVAAQLLLQGLTGIVGDSKLDYGALRRVTVIQIAELGVAATLVTEAKSETFASGSRLRIEIAGIILDEYSKIYVKLRAQ